MDLGLGKIWEGLIGAGKDIFDDLHTSEEEKTEAKLKFEAILVEKTKAANQQVLQRFQMVADVIKAEMNSGDNYTKRARPTLVYFGMVVIAWNYCVLPVVGGTPVELPMEFWVAWGGTVSIWSLGRSGERMTANKDMNSGNAKRLKSVLDVING